MDCKATSRSRKHKASNLQCFRPDQQYSGSMPKSHGDTLTHLFGDIVPVETHYCETVGLGHRVRLVAAIENGGHVVGPLMHEGMRCLHWVRGLPLRNQPSEQQFKAATRSHVHTHAQQHTPTRTHAHPTDNRGQPRTAAEIKTHTCNLTSSAKSAALVSPPKNSPGIIYIK